MKFSARFVILPLLLVLVASWSFSHSFPVPVPANDGNVQYKIEGVQQGNQNVVGTKAKENADQEGPHIEGDIIRSRKSGAIDVGERWPNKQVIYEFGSKFRVPATYTISDGMEMISSQTCVTFKKRTNETNYISIQNTQPECSSEVGMQGGEQIVNIGHLCYKAGIIVHEFLHTLGFLHEHTRADRDEWIYINWFNIERRNHYNFFKREDDVNVFNISYDYGSIMHYSRDAFSNGLGDTIEPRLMINQTQVTRAQTNIGQRENLSSLDVLRINRMYNCTGKEEVKGEGSEASIDSGCFKPFVSPGLHGSMSFLAIAMAQILKSYH